MRAAILLLASLLLAFAAQTAGLGPDHPDPPRLLRAALLHRPRRGCRRGPVLGGDHAVPAARRPDPGGADVRQRPAAAHRDHCRGADVPRRPGGANRRHRNTRPGEDGAIRRPGLEGARPARRRDRDHARRSHRAACDRGAGRRARRGRARRPGRPEIRGTGSGQTRTSRARTIAYEEAATGEVAAPGTAERRLADRRRPGGRPDADGQQARGASPRPRSSTTSCRPRSCFSGARGTRART